MLQPLCALLFSTVQYHPAAVEILACCNVSTVTISRHRLDDKGIGSSGTPLVTLRRRTPSVPSDEDGGGREDEYLGTPQQISVCSDRHEPTIGYVEPRGNVQCSHHNLDSFMLPNGTLPLPAWYYICYKLDGGCESCKMEMLCPPFETKKCNELSIGGRVRDVHAQNVTYHVKVGPKFPFSLAEVASRVTISRWRENGTHEHKDVALKGDDPSVLFDDLKPRHAYRVTRCLLHTRSNQTFGCTTETFQTKGSSIYFSIGLLALLACVFQLVCY